MWRKPLTAVLLALASLVAYWPLGHSNFLNLDDPTYVTNNPEVLRGLSYQGFAWAFTTLHGCNWHPLTWLSHMLDCQFFGSSPAGPHLVNLVLHAANSLLLLGFLQRITGAFWRSAVVAGLFALHPLHVESVAWVAERKDVLSTFFFLLTLSAYAEYADKSKVQSLESKVVGAPATCHTARFYFLSLLLFALGLMCKPMLVTLPFVLLLLDCWPFERFRAPDRKPAFRTAFLLLREKIPFLLIAAVSCVVTVVAQARGGAVASMERLPLLPRGLNAAVAYSGYLAKTVWLVDLTVIYPFNGNWQLWRIALALAILLGGSLLAVLARKRCPYLFVGWFWYIGTLVPVIGIVQVGVHSMADRYTYLPLIGLFIAAVWSGADWLESRRQPRALGIALGCALVVACGTITRNQVRYWHDDDTLFRHAIQVSPQNFLALHHLGLSCLSAGKLSEAVEHLSASLRLEPAYPQAHFARGMAFGMSGNLYAAATDFQEAIHLKPDYYQAYAQLGKVQALQSQLKEARTSFLEAVRLKPDYAEAQTLLGNVLQLQGKRDEAILHLRAAVTAQPDYGEGHYFLAIALTYQHELPEAATHLEATIKLRPDFAPAFKDLSLILIAQDNPSLRNVARGVQLAERACKMTGYQDPDCLQAYATACAEAGRFPEAAQLAQKALQIALAKGDADMAAHLRSQLAHFQARQPDREDLR